MCIITSFVLFCIILQGAISTAPTVEVAQGKLKGAVLPLLDGSSYYAFKGIPYARPPIGNLRFKAPLPPKRWNGIRDAIDYGPICIQYDFTVNEHKGSEDCLSVNVFTKTLNSSAMIPVMVYIHGGSYMSQSGNNDTIGPEFILQHDVILVTMNYRLEILGFLAMDIKEAPGNAGMKDQVAALKWIQENIQNFGGDPNQVTIFGESAGAASVTSHMLSPLSQGLFNKAIAQSGICIQDLTIGQDTVNRGFRVGKALGKETRNPNELVHFLKKVPAIQLTNMTVKTATDDEINRGLVVRFVPVIEKKFHGITNFMDRHPLGILESDNLKAVPLMIGYNSNEGLFIVSDQLKKLDLINANPHLLVPEEVSKRVGITKEKEFGERILRFYVGTRRNLTLNDVQIISDIQSDIHFVYNTHRFANFYSYYRKPVYMYKFGYSTELNIVKNLILGLSDYSGASHADDLFYFFFNRLNKNIYDKNRNLQQTVFKITKLWTDFAKTSNPTPDQSSGIQWLPYTKDRKEYMNLEHPWSLRTYAEKDRVQFWNKMYCEAGLPCMAD